MSVVILSGMNLVSFAESENSWKNKIDEEIYEKITDKDTKVPVYIWLTDVEHEEVIAETEETLGYGEEDLAVIDEDFSDELAISVSNLSETDDESVSDELAKYLKKDDFKNYVNKIHGRSELFTSSVSSFRRRSIFPGSCPPSIVDAKELNFRVRDGNGWDLLAKTTG